jgi:hypothetical protein
MEAPEISVEPPPYEARAMVRWAEGAAEGQYQSAETLGWMARESEGETLATIAATEGQPPDRIRQRVSRLRRALQRRWTRELALAAGAVLVVLLGWWWSTEPAKPRVIRDRWRISPAPALQQARQLRQGALDACAEQRWRRCLEGLDRADKLDPAGADQPAIRAARRRANEALTAPSPEPTTSSTSAPSTEPTSSPAPKPPTTSTTPLAPKRTKPLGPKYRPKPGLGTK